MIEMDLKQITDRLNTVFTGEARRLVFWYDDKAEFVEDIDGLQLENAKVLKLEANNQFKTKYFLERQDRTTNYLIYAPFPKPDVRVNHLEDILQYSVRFHADRASYIVADLHIEEQFKPLIEKYVKFFNNKERTQRFYDLEIENYNNETIIVGLMSALCRTRTCSFDEVLRVLLTGEKLQDNPYMEEFVKYDLIDEFWKCCEQQFGYTDNEPTLEKLLVTLFVTYAGKYIQGELPKSWQTFVSYKSGNIIAFLDSLMNNYLYRDSYDALSEHVAVGLHAPQVLGDYAPDALLECDSFKEIDHCILKWLIARLLAEDTGAALSGRSIQEICEMRQKMHFGPVFAKQYELLDSAYTLIMAAHYSCPDDFAAIIKQYAEQDYLLDQTYRHFYYCYDSMDSNSAYEALRDLVENIYTHEYLERQMPRWNAGFVKEAATTMLPLQRNFYSHYVQPVKERVVVIISDAMRYEVGQELFKTLQDDPKCTAKIETMLSTVPSYTQLGMAALLPHRTLSLSKDGRELADEVYCNDLSSRQKVLQTYEPASCSVRFDDVKNMKKASLREVFTGKQVVYVYHDQIDVRGEHAEDEVFVACCEAVTEIATFIRRVTVNANTVHFIVTADHGFIYKRKAVPESGKIGGVNDKSRLVKRRYIVAADPVQDDGICHISLGSVLGNMDERIVSFPCSTSVFKTQGSGGQNYVHGGSSPQEMLIPVLDIKMEKGHMETKMVQITLVSLVQKITNLITTLEFLQTEPISDVVKETKFHIYFISEDNERISNENIYIADNRDETATNRIFRQRFTFKNKKYDKDKQYYLVAFDDSNNLEVFRHAVVMDLAFANDFGFDLL
jgi:uncharacterized protein (TIGR02687 family)